MQPTPVFLPGKSHGQRSLAGYSPWGCKESDTTELTHAPCSHTDSPNLLFIVFHLFLFCRCQIQLTSVDCLSHSPEAVLLNAPALPKLRIPLLLIWSQTFIYNLWAEAFRNELLQLLVFSFNFSHFIQSQKKKYLLFLKAEPPTCTVDCSSAFFKKILKLHLVLVASLRSSVAVQIL